MSLPEHVSGRAAERALIGSLLLSKNAVADAVPLLEPGDFGDPSARFAFAAAKTLVGRGEPVDHTSILFELEKDGHVGMMPFLKACSSEVPATIHAHNYARMIRDAAVRRDLIAASARIAEAARTAPTAEEAYELAVQALAEVRTPLGGGPADSYSATLEEGIKRAIFRDGPLQDPLSTGFWELDKELGGLFPGQLIVLGARASLGKTSFASGLAFAAIDGRESTVAFFGLEMPSSEMSLRMAASRLRLNFHDLRRGLLTPEASYALSEESDRAASVPLIVIDQPSISVSGIRRTLRTRLRGTRPSLVVVDYLQLVRSEGRHENRQVEVASISRALKRMASDLDCPVVVCAQLNRAPEARASKRPEIADLRESGQLEGDADVVLLLYRDDFYHRDSPEAGTAEVHVAKNRNGPTGMVRLGWDGPSMSFYSMFDQPANQEKLV